MSGLEINVGALSPSEATPTTRDAAAFVWSALNVAEDAGAPAAVLENLVSALRVLEDFCEAEHRPPC